jgi:hypothetical protein
MLQQVRNDAQLLAETMDGKMEWNIVYLKLAMPVFGIHELAVFPKIQNFLRFLPARQTTFLSPSGQHDLSPRGAAYL